MKMKIVVICLLVFAMISLADGIVCTQDVKQCPDGSWVARDPDNHCEFKSCSQPPPIIPIDKNCSDSSGFFYYQELNCVGNCTLINAIHVTDTTTVIRQNNFYGGGLTEWDFAWLINNAMDNLDGRGVSTAESRLIATSLANHFVTQYQFNYTMNDIYSQLQNIEIREMILEKAMNMTNSTIFCNAKKGILTELGLIYVKCDHAVYWYNGITINMTPISVKIVTPENTANVVLNSMQEIDITNSLMKSITVEIGNRGNVTETAVISLEFPENEDEYTYPENFTITLEPHQLEAVAFLLKRDVGETCISDQDCRIGFCMPTMVGAISSISPPYTICKPRVYFKAPSIAYDGDNITVQLLSQEDKPMANATIFVRHGNNEKRLITNGDGKAFYIGVKNNVYSYSTNDYPMQSNSVVTSVYWRIERKQIDVTPLNSSSMPPLVYTSNQTTQPESRFYGSTDLLIPLVMLLFGIFIALIVLVLHFGDESKKKTKKVK